MGPPLPLLLLAPAAPVVPEAVVGACIALGIGVGMVVLEKEKAFFASPPKGPLPIYRPTNMSVDTEKCAHTLREEARKEIGIDSINHFNFGIVGNSGTGKSALINALTQVRPGDPNYATEGEAETTLEITSYKLTNHAVVWDVPGVGTAKTPPDTYVTKNKLYAFDVIVVCTADRFTEGELRVAAELKKWKTPIVFVRTKTDIALDSKLGRLGTAKRSDKIGNAKRELRSETEAAIRPQLIPYDYGTSQIFFVSSWVLRAIQDPRDPSHTWDEYDEETLDELRKIKRLRQFEMDEISLFMYIAKTASIRRGGGAEN
ncbi:hypothetical protein SeLEV6574_g00650 [Synchytrium endobioticum]|uniref:IRG-type G domain-containing protein n=1 Tax=Synchytrium endobioticum TaxID=286115 RepID=A0A507DJ11_9FUNG|nr:hypothetical protein SeLEV6574_g00650 [Synchytrium endobioticum]